MSTDTPTFTFVKTTGVAIPQYETRNGYRDLMGTDHVTVDVFKNDQTGRLHIVRKYNGNQYTSVMPRDVPSSGWDIARQNDAGIAYLTTGYSASSLHGYEEQYDEAEDNA